MMQKRWTLAEGQAVLRRIEAAARSAGYYVGIYGSVARDGDGRDLDLVAVPWRYGASYAGLVAGIRRSLPDVAEIGEPYHGLMGTRAVAFEVGGKVVDLQIREVDTAAR